MKNKFFIFLFFSGFFELFDFMLFLYLYDFILNDFFQQSNHEVSFLFILTGYLSKPLGAFLSNSIQKKYSWKHIFEFSIFLTALANFVLFFLPTYSQIGILSTVVLISMRIIQGICCGSDIPILIQFIHFFDPKEKTKLLSILFGLLTLGSVCAKLSYFTVNYFHWNYRILFLLTGILCIFAYLVRNLFFSCYQNQHSESNFHWNSVIKSFLIYSYGCLIMIPIFVLIPIYKSIIHPEQKSLISFTSMTSLIIISISCFLIPKLNFSRHFSEIEKFLVGMILTAISFPFLFLTIVYKNGFLYFISMSILSIFSSLVFSPILYLSSKLIYENKNSILIIGLTQTSSQILMSQISELVYLKNINSTRNFIYPILFFEILSFILFFYLRKEKKNDIHYSWQR